MTTPTKSRASKRVTPDAVLADSVGRDVLDARIAVLEPAVRRQDGITPAMLDAERPGGQNNPDQSGSGALSYLCWLHRTHAQGPTQQVTGAGRWDARGMDDMRAAMAAEPIYVTLESGRQVGVYPKGFAALNRVADNMLALEWINGVRLGVLSVEEHNAHSLDALRKATEAENHLVAEFVSIITCVGPDVPWAEDGRWDHKPESWAQKEITPHDLIQLRRAFVDCNLLRISAIAERTRAYATGASEALPLSAFLGIMAGEMGVRPEEITRRYSLGEVFAMSLARFEAHERARAKADAAKPPKPGR